MNIHTSFEFSDYCALNKIRILDYELNKRLLAFSSKAFQLSSKLACTKTS